LADERDPFDERAVPRIEQCRFSRPRQTLVRPRGAKRGECSGFLASGHDEERHLRRQLRVAKPLDRVHVVGEQEDDRAVGSGDLRVKHVDGDARDLVAESPHALRDRRQGVALPDEKCLHPPGRVHRVHPRVFLCSA